MDVYMSFVCYVRHTVYYIFHTFLRLQKVDPVELIYLLPDMFFETWTGLVDPAKPRPP